MKRRQPDNIPAARRTEIFTLRDVVEDMRARLRMERRPWDRTRWCYLVAQATDPTLVIPAAFGRSATLSTPLFATGLFQVFTRWGLSLG